MGKIILTGDRPTGRLHLGHYVGSLRRRVELQKAVSRQADWGMFLSLQALCLKSLGAPAKRVGFGFYAPVKRSQAAARRRASLLSAVEIHRVRGRARVSASQARGMQARRLARAQRR